MALFSVNVVAFDVGSGRHLVVNQAIDLIWLKTTLSFREINDGLELVVLSGEHKLVFNILLLMLGSVSCEKPLRHY